MPRLDTEVQTGTTISEKISIGFMVGVGLVVVASVLAAGAYLGWNKLTAGAALSEQTITTNTVTTTGNTNSNDVESGTVQGAETDRVFNTE